MDNSTSIQHLKEEEEGNTTSIEDLQESENNQQNNSHFAFVDDNKQMTMTQTSDPALVGMCRKLSVSVQLSHGTDYEGGDMEFTDLPSDQSHKELNIWTNPEFRKKGTVIVFPSFIRHRVTPVTKGTRYSAVAWINGPPLR